MESHHLVYIMKVVMLLCKVTFDFKDIGLTLNKKFLIFFKLLVLKVKVMNIEEIVPAVVEMLSFIQNFLFVNIDLSMHLMRIWCWGFFLMIKVGFRIA